MRLIKVSFLIGVLSFSMAACNIFSAPEAVLGSTDFSFGDVVNGEIVAHEVSLKNSGDAPLIIEYISTSCGCTTAESDLDTLLPGEETTIHIEFDSGAHGPDGNGELVRQVFIQTNDPKQEQLEIRFDVNVLAAEK